MNQILEIRNNPIYQLNNDGNELQPCIEIIVIYTDGRNYQLVKGKKGETLKTDLKISESRFVVYPDALGKFIGSLKLIQQNMSKLQNNATGINQIVKQFMEMDEEGGGDEK